MANITASVTATDSNKKFIAANLIKRTYLRCVAASVCDKVQMEKGSGKIAYFTRFNRMTLPTSTLTEGSNPTARAFTLTGVNVTLDQWGDVITLTDVAQLTTFHPLLTQAMELLADNMVRIIDREIQIVWFAGTNVQYGGSGNTARGDLANGDSISDTVIHKAVVTLDDYGAQPRSGPSNRDAKAESATPAGPRMYLGVAGPQVMADIKTASTSLGTWASVMMYANAKALYANEEGEWLGVRWVKTNFIPKITILGNTTEAVTTGNAFGTDTPVVSAVNGGGSLNSATTFFFKVTRKDLLRGFEEQISIPHSMASAATGNNESFTFDFSAVTAGYVYNVYFDTVATGGTGTDATLRLVAENVAVGSTVTVTAVPSSGANPPANPAAAVTQTIHPIYFFGEDACSWVGLQNLSTHITADQSTPSDVLQLTKSIGAKFMGKAIIKDQFKMLRVEVTSAY